MAQEPQLGRAAGPARFPNASNPLLGFADPSGDPGPYTMKGSAPRGGPAGVPGVEPGPKPGVRSSTTAAPSEDTVPSDRAGAVLRVVTNSTAQRSLAVRDLTRPVARYDVHADRDGATVMRYHGGVSPLWAKRRAQVQAQDQDR